MMLGGLAPLVLSGSGLAQTVYGFGNPPWNLTSTSRLSVTASGGTGSFTYSWSRVSGSTSLSPLAADSSLSNPRAYISGTAIARHEGVFRCTVSDGVQSESIDLPVNILVQMS